MRVLRFEIPPACEGMTVRDFARKQAGLSARFLTKQKQLPSGILKNGFPCRTVDRLSTGDVLSFPLPEEVPEYLEVSTSLTVLWETEDYLAVEKPPDMPVHPSPGHNRDSLLNAVAYYYRQTGQQHLFRPLYRLDKDTSGVLVIGKHRAAVSTAVIEKRYFAVCEGELSGSGTIDLPIGLREGSKIVRACGFGEKAVTHWKAIACEEGHTLLSLCLETGRTHQIRAHMAHFGHPLAGDDLYGGSRERIGRQALHCGLVSVFSKALAVKAEITSELPADFCTAFPWLFRLREIEQEKTL